MPSKKIKNQKLKIKNQRGATAILTAVFVMSTILMIALTAATIMIYEIQMSREITNSVPAFFAADAGAEKCLYQARKLTDNLECNKNNGSTSVTLDNGASAVANRQNKIINVSGTFSQTKRSVELSWQ